MMKLRNRQTVPNVSLPKSTVQQLEPLPEKCISLNILAEPAGPIRADIIFIHGLHGNAWFMIN